MSRNLISKHMIPNENELHIAYKLGNKSSQMFEKKKKNDFKSNRGF